ncbi:hypothetical protein BH09PAT4_BH09PAT4_01580 [soil metagenome]
MQVLDTRERVRPLHLEPRQQRVDPVGQALVVVVLLHRGLDLLRARGLDVQERNEGLGLVVDLTRRLVGLEPGVQRQHRHAVDLEAGEHVGDGDPVERVMADRALDTSQPSGEGGTQCIRPLARRDTLERTHVVLHDVLFGDGLALLGHRGDSEELGDLRLGLGVRGRLVLRRTGGTKRDRRDDGDDHQDRDGDPGLDGVALPRVAVHADHIFLKSLGLGV